MAIPKPDYIISATTADGARQTFTTVMAAAAALEVEPNEIVRALFLRKPLKGMAIARETKAVWVRVRYRPKMTEDDVAIIDKIAEMGGFATHNDWLDALIRDAIQKAIPRLREAGAIPTPKLPLTHGRDDYE